MFGISTTSNIPSLIICLVAYATCNSTMLILNKLCITYIHSPNAILVAQLAFNAAFICLLHKLGMIDCDPIEMGKVTKFSPVVLGFVLLLYTNLRAIDRVPVDTFVCARASLPCITALLEFVFLGRQLPSLRSSASLIFIALGAFFYVRTDVQFDIRGYMWLGMWYLMSILENLWVKHVITTLDMTQWGRSLYSNIFSLPFCFVIAGASGEFRALEEQIWNKTSCIYLVLSCFAAVAMSYSSFHLRDLISATSFTVVGNVCKLNTLLINYTIWDKHASPQGIRALLVTLAAAAFYEQAPYRTKTQGLMAHVKERLMTCFPSGQIVERDSE